MAAEFLLVRKRVLNDFPCPECRMYEISFHATFDEACSSVPSILAKPEDNRLSTRGWCWIDEWERRRNGDLYCIIPINDHIRLNLHDNLREYCDTESSLCDNPATFCLLAIIIDKNENCPYNADYEITAVDKENCLNIARMHIRDELKEVTIEELDNCESILARPASTWIKTDPKTGLFLELMPIELWKKINITKKCAALSHGQWQLDET